MKQSEFKTIYTWCFILTVLFFSMTMISCTTAQKHEVAIPIETETHAPVVKTPEVQLPLIEIPALSWENTTKPHPERAEWSQILVSEIDKHFDSLDKAKDIGKFCPKYSSLNKGQKINAWGELFVWTAYYESGFDPKNADVDVGSEDDTSTWSTGLWQVSAIDREAYSLQKVVPYYSFEDLKKVKPNAELTMAIMARQINKYGLILLPSRSGLYWATLYPGGSYDESDNIISHVKKLSFCK